mgnify:CR=1 FL=1
MKWTTFIAAMAALCVATQSADAGLLDFLRINLQGNTRPKCAKPAKPARPKGLAKPKASSKPRSPANPTTPAKPRCAKPARPKVSVKPRCAKPARPTKPVYESKRQGLFPKIRLPRIRRITIFRPKACD